MWHRVPSGGRMLKYTKTAPSLIKVRHDVSEILIRHVAQKYGIDPKVLKSEYCKKCEEDEDCECPEEGIPDELAELMGMARSRDREILEDRGILSINTYISKETLARATRRLLVLHFDNEFTDDIQIIINSPGGYTNAGWAFIDMMKFIKNKVVTIAVGEICSMATDIFIAGDERIMSPNSIAMIHQYRGYTEGTYADLVAGRKMEDMEAAKGVRHLIECSKYNTEQEVRKHLLKDHDHWMSPQEMKRHGLCDKITRNKKKVKCKK